ncbi:hypothetical protein EBR57_10190, partial [bacterium]|nr:hypothetical protein [bacterium]
GYLETSELTAEQFVRIRDLVANLQYPRPDGPLNHWHSNATGHSVYSSEKDAWRAEVLANIKAAKAELSTEIGEFLFSNLVNSSTLYGDRTNDFIFNRSSFDFIKVFADGDALADGEKVRDTIEMIGLAVHLRTNDRVAHYGNQLDSALNGALFDVASAALKGLDTIEQQHQWLLQCSEMLTPRVEGDNTIGNTPMDLAEAAYQVDMRRRLEALLLTPVLPNRTEFARLDSRQGGAELLTFVQAPQLMLQQRDEGIVVAGDLDRFCVRIDQVAGLFVSDKSIPRTEDHLPPVVGYTLPMVSLLGMLKSVSDHCTDGGAAVRTAFGNTGLGQSINRASDDTRVLDQFTYDLFLEFWKFLNPAAEGRPSIQVAVQNDEVPLSEIRPGGGSSNGSQETAILGLNGLIVGTAEWY